MRAALVVGARDDIHVERVCARLSRPVMIVDAESLSRIEFAVTGERVVLDDGESRVAWSTDEPARGWLRRVAPLNWQAGVAPPSQQFAEMSSWLALLSALARGGNARWLTGLDESVRADNKLVVHQAAQAARVRTPWTVVTNDARRLGAPDEIVVVKPLGPGHFVDERGEAHNVFATAVAVRELRPDLLAAAPFLIQEFLRAVKHRRVVTVLGAVWSAVLDAEGLPLDWRSEPAAHGDFRFELTPSAVAAGASAIARQLNLGYSSQDWVETVEGEHVLLDVNPAGQWLFLPDAVANPVTAAIADWLDDDD